MTNLTFTDQLAALRGLVFDAIDEWNAAHPHPLPSHHERASINVSHVYADATGLASYAITVVCGLSGSAQLTFHGHDLATVAEHARLTLEHRIANEIHRRVDKMYEDEFDRKYGVAV